MLGQYGLQYLASILFLGGTGFLIARFTNSRGFVLGALAILSGTALAFPSLVRFVPSSLLRYFPPLYLKPLYALGYPPTAMVARAGIDLPVEATLGLLVGAAVLAIFIGMAVTRTTRSW